MTNTEILYSSLNPKPFGAVVAYKGLCKVCGKSISKAVHENNVLSANFTNFDECKYRKSNYICIECASVMKEASLRRNNFVSDKNNIYLLKKNDLENFLFDLADYIEGEFIVGITRSFKKHNSFRCRVNSNTNRFYIREEDKEYEFDVLTLKKVYEMLNEAYMQFSKEELLSGKYNLLAVEQFGEKFEKCENVFKRHRSSAQFDLLVYMMNSERRNEIIKERKIKK